MNIKLNIQEELNGYIDIIDTLRNKIDFFDRDPSIINYQNLVYFTNYFSESADRIQNIINNYLDDNYKINIQKVSKDNE